MTKIVFNNCFGGFALSKDAWAEYLKRRDLTEEDCEKHDLCRHEIERTCPVLVAIVEEWGDNANGECAMLRIRDLAPGTKYRIDNYDGNERIMTIDEHSWLVA